MLKQFRDGLKNFYAAEIMRLIAPLLASFSTVILSAVVYSVIGSSYSMSDGYVKSLLSGLGVLAVITTLLSLIGYIVPIVAYLLFAIGAGKALKYEESFRVPCYLYIACIALNTVVVILTFQSINPSALLGNLMNNRVISNLLVIILMMVFAYIAEFLGVIYWFSGMRSAAEKMNRDDLVALCIKRKTWVIVLFVLSSLVQLITTILSIKGSSSVFLSIVGVVVAVIWHAQMISFVKTVKNASTDYEESNLMS